MTNEKVGQKYSGRERCNHRGVQNYKGWIFLPYLLFFLLAACENVPQGDSSYAVTAVWDDQTSTLNISGNTLASEESIEIHDAADGSLLGMAVVKENGSWSATATTPACEVHVALPEGTTTFAVQNSPENCTSSASYARALQDGGQLTSAEDIPANVLVVSNPVLLNTVPNAVILNPPQDITINVGQIVNFQGVAVGSSVQPPFSYYWNFGGAAPNATIQNPGSIRFDVPGTYFVQLSASDNLGIPDPTPAVRTITVNNPNFPFSVVPVPSILAPTAVNGSVSINVGDTVFFAGAATDSLGSTSFTYEWNFSGIYPTRFGATAGSIPFNQAGAFQVRLYATNVQGIRSTIPATVTVLVGAVSGTNQSPTGAITRPRNDVIITAGESLIFRARGQDPDNTLPLFYSWDFQGVAPNVTKSADDSAGSVTFNTPGVYYIRMTVSDSLGASDPNPPIRTVTVQNATLPPPSNGVLSTQITSPPTDLIILPGQSVFFSGQVLGLPNAGLLQYHWNFGGAAVDSNLLIPGSITFPNPGQYFVTFFTTDSTGNMVGTPTSRTVTVSDPSNVSAKIASPVDGSTVTVGQQINMIGQVNNSVGFTILDYNWKIKQRGSESSLFTSTKLSPGKYIFTQPGDYVLEFEVSGTDAFGNTTLSSEAKSRIKVSNPIFPVPGQGVASAGIMLPATDMVIYVGNSVDFEANTIVGTNIKYSWDFSGVRPPTINRNPNPVTFNIPGVYYVTLRVSGVVNGSLLDLYDQRIITVLQQNSSFPPSPVPGSSGSSIQSPATDQVINVGSSVNFAATSVAGTNIAYNWNFGGARSPSTRRSPGILTFNTPGNYLVTLLVTGIVNGLPINNFDQRIITVISANPPLPPATNPSPLGTGILTPASDVVVNAGAFVEFRASNIVGVNITYSWNFGLASAPTSQRNPSPVQFNFPGSYLVSVQISGTVNGLPYNMYDHRVVTVLQSNSTVPTPTPPIGGTSLPEGFITQPAQSVVTVSVGQPVLFMGSGFDPLGTGALTFQWSFGGSQRNILAQNPGSVTFNRAGRYVVTLLVQNALGQYDTTPPTVVVTVQ